MGTEVGRPAAALSGVLKRLYERPFEFDFFQAVRLIQRAGPGRAAVGPRTDPAQDLVRFGAHVSSAFPASSIQDLEASGHKGPFPQVPRMVVNFMGLIGPSGVLPSHYTDQVIDYQHAGYKNHKDEATRERMRSERYAPRDWFDVFNHRLISLFYMAWERYRFYVPFERGDHLKDEPDDYSQALFSLVGLGQEPLRRRLVVTLPKPALPKGQPAPVARRNQPEPPKLEDVALFRYAGLFSDTHRHPFGLRVVIAGLFRCEVAVECFRGQWLALSANQQTRVGRRGTLGVDAIAGQRVWDVEGRFRIRIGPLGYAQFMELLPDRSASPLHKTFFLLCRVIRLYAGPELDFEVQLVLRRRDVPACKLEKVADPGPRLGWNTWMLSSLPARRDADEVVFSARESPTGSADVL